MMLGTGFNRRAMLRAAATSGVGFGLAAAGAAAPTRAAAQNDGAESVPDRRIAMLLFDGITAMDAIGPYEVLSRVPGFSLITVGKRIGSVRTDTGILSLGVDHSLKQVRRADVLLIPGGNVSGVRTDPETIRWIQQLHRHTTWTVSVCTGSLVLGAAGLLHGLPATTYWGLRTELDQYGATYVPERFVETGRIITAAGISAGIDMALHLAAKLADDRTAQALQLAVEYDPQPPFDTGSPDKAGQDLQRLALQLLRGAGQ